MSTIRRVLPVRWGSGGSGDYPAASGRVHSFVARSGPAAFVALAALGVHGPSIAFGFTDLDDRDLVVDDQPFLIRWSSLWRAFGRSYMHRVDAQHPYYRPLVTASYVLDAHWSGVRPIGFHATNVIVHVAASLLFLLLLRRLGLGGMVALVAAAVFAVHPVLVCAVEWIPGRNDSLLAVFVFAAWLAFLSDRERPSWLARAAHMVFFGLALLTKETAAVLPLVLVAHTALMEGERARLVHWRGAVASTVIGWCFCLTARFGASIATLPRGMAGALVGHASLLPSGFGQVVFPVNPTLLAVTDDAPIGLGLVAMALLASLTGLVPGVRRRTVALGVVVFALWSLPPLAMPGTLTLNHRLYLPACGVLIAFAEIVRAVAAERRAVAAFGAGTVAALGALALAFGATFHDRRVFALASVDTAPLAPLAHVCLGRVCQLDGDDDRALAEYASAIGLGAVDVVHNNMAVIHMAHARWSDAEREIHEELRVDPRYARAYDNLAIVLFRTGRFDDARAAAGRARALAAE